MVRKQTMRHLGVLEAKTEFSAIVAEVERTGEEVVVTRYGKAAVLISRAVDPEGVSDRETIISRILRRLEADGPDLSAEDKEAELADLLDRNRDDAWS